MNTERDIITDPALFFETINMLNAKLNAFAKTKEACENNFGMTLASQQKCEE